LTLPIRGRAEDLAAFFALTLVLVVVFPAVFRLAGRAARFRTGFRADFLACFRAPFAARVAFFAPPFRVPVFRFALAMRSSSFTATVAPIPRLTLTVRL
jgi:hypothetical protein